MGHEGRRAWKAFCVAGQRRARCLLAAPRPRRSLLALQFSEEGELCEACVEGQGDDAEDRGEEQEA